MTIEKVKQIAHEKYGKDLTDEQASGYIEKYGKLSDDELDNVSGGYSCLEEEFWYGKYCETCGVWCDRNNIFDRNGDLNPSGSWVCPVCGTIYK